MTKFLRLGVVLLITANAKASELENKLRQLAGSHHGNVALFAKNLTTGETLSLDANRPVQTASVIKLPLMLQVFEQVKSGQLNLSTSLKLTKENQVPGSGVLNLMNPGLMLTLKETVTLMMVLSDNTATNMVIDAAGLGSTNRMLARMQLESTYLYKKVYKEPEGPMPPDQKDFGLGKTTAKEMAQVMEDIYRCEIKALDLCREMITIMRYC